MRTIGICNTKGGGGKSTLCVSLARYVHASGKKVALIDLDSGQGSTTSWANARARGKLTPGPELVKIRSLRPDLRRLEARGIDYTFIDSPPTLDDSGVVEAAVEASDYVLSPCRPSILDIGAAQTIAELAGTTPLGFVLMDVTTGTGWQGINREALKALQDVGHVFKQQITHRPAYVDNMAIGSTGPETDKTALTEISRLWVEVAVWMK